MRLSISRSHTFPLSLSLSPLLPFSPSLFRLLQSAIRTPHSALKNGFCYFRRLRAVSAFEEDQRSKLDPIGSRRADGAFLRREPDKPALRAPLDAGGRSAGLAEDIAR